MGIGMVFGMAMMTVGAIVFFVMGGDYYSSTFIGMMVSLGLYLILALVFWKTPAGVFLTAWFKKMSILELTSKDRRKQFLPVVIKDKVIRLKKRGETFIVTENSIYNERNSGIPILEANSDYGVTVAPVQMLRSMGLKGAGFENIGEVENSIKCKSCKEITLIKNLPYKKDTADPTKMIFRCPTCKVEVTEAKFDKFFEYNFEINYPKNETIRVHDMTGFMKYNLSPSIIDTTIEKSVQLAMEEQRGFSMATVAKIAGIGIVIMCIAIAYVIITQNTASMSCPACVCNYEPAVIGGG